MNSSRTIVRPEQAGNVLGVLGRYSNVIAWPDDPKLPERCRGKIAAQEWTSEARAVSGYGTAGRMTVKIRHDDNCKNGHETFSITATVSTVESRSQGDIAAGGCMHDDIVKVFPELAPLIKWHLCSTDQPLHYVANTVYLAGDRDHNGLLKGERRQIKNGRTGELCWRLMAIDKDVNELEVHDIDKSVNGATQPQSRFTLEYRPWCRVGEGKDRELEAARRTAIWPEATDEQLSLPKEELTKLLVDRHPALMEQFKAAIENCGLIYQL